jgi:hypothetical protein
MLRSQMANHYRHEYHTKLINSVNKFAKLKAMGLASLNSLGYMPLMPSSRQSKATVTADQFQPFYVFD